MDVQPLKLRATGNGQIINRWYLTRPLVTTSDIAQDTHYPWLVLIRRLAIPISVDISVNNLSLWSNSFSWCLLHGDCGVVCVGQYSCCSDNMFSYPLTKTVIVCKRNMKQQGCFPFISRFNFLVFTPDSVETICDAKLKPGTWNFLPKILILQHARGDHTVDLNITISIFWLSR